MSAATENIDEMYRDDLLNSMLERVGEEVRSAMAKHASLKSSHEAYAVILEELDEFWEEVRKKRELRSNAKMSLELIQTAAMCVRAIYDLGLFLVKEHDLPVIQRPTPKEF